jgi:hypothetical protein
VRGQRAPRRRDDTRYPVVRQREIERMGADQSGRAGDQQRCHLARSIMIPSPRRPAQGPSLMICIEDLAFIFSGLSATFLL